MRCFAQLGLLGLNLSLASSLFACARLPAESDIVGLASDGTPTKTSPSGTPSASSSTSSATGVGVVTAARGMALRWHADASKCIARQNASPTTGDQLILATCASDLRQAWTCVLGICFADTKHYIGAPASDSFLSVQDDVNQILALKGNGGSVPLYTWTGTSVRGYLSPTDSSGPLEQPIVIAPPAVIGASYTFWDQTGVGATLRGTTLALKGLDAFCLTKASQSVNLSACDVSNAAQRWSLQAGALLCDAGQYLTVDVTRTPPLLQMSDSASNTLSNNQGWYFFSDGLKYATNSNAGTPLYLTGDGNTLKAFVASDDAAHSGSHYVFGGTLTSN